MEQTQLVELITREVVAQINRHSLPSVNGGEAKYMAGWSGGQPTAKPAAKLVPVAVSVRHVHLAQAEIDILFGRGYSLRKLRGLFQPGEFAAQEVVTLVGPKLRSLANVRVLGPVRPRTQVEISRTDAVTIGLDVPVRPSGQLRGAASITLVGPKGSLTLPDCCIIANRHIHISTAEAKRWGFQDNQRVQVRVTSAKPAVMGDVQIRTGDKYKLIMHIDTDDANAMEMQCGSSVEILDGE